MPGKVAAVYAGHIFWLQRLQSRRLVPIVKMAAIQCELTERMAGRFQSLDGFFRADPSQVPRAQIRKQTQSYVCRRGAMRHDRPRFFLEIVRWQPVIRVRYKFFEETPGTPGNGAQRA